MYLLMVSFVIYVFVQLCVFLVFARPLVIAFSLFRSLFRSVFISLCLHVVLYLFLYVCMYVCRVLFRSFFIYSCMCL